MPTGNESASELLSAYPGERDPMDYVDVKLTGNTVTVTSSYTPVGHGIASVVSRQYMDAVARRTLPGVRIASERTAGIYGAFRLGSRIRVYVKEGK